LQSRVASGVVIAMNAVEDNGKLDLVSKIAEVQPSPNREAALNATRALEHCPVAIALASLSGELLSINAEAAGIFGISHGESLSGRYIADTFVEASHLAALEAVARDGRARQFELFSRKEEGLGRRFLCRLARITAANGIPAWLALGMFEYGDQFYVDGPSGSTAKTASDIHQLAGLATWMIRGDDDADLGASTMEWSPELFRLLNAKPSLRRLTLHDYLEFVAADERDAVLVALSRSFADGASVSVVHRLQPDNGASKVVASRATPIRDPVAGLTRDIWGVDQDVTSIFEGRLPSHEKASILDSLASNMEGPIYAVDREFRFTYFNEFVRREMRDVFGADPEVGVKAIGVGHRRARRKVMLGNLRRALGGARIVEEVLIPCDKLTARYYELTYSPIVVGSMTTGVAVFGVRLKRDPNFLTSSVRSKRRATAMHA
jgi:PAS domain-containing protein